jgi:hypothetical protein
MSMCRSLVLVLLVALLACPAMAVELPQQMRTTDGFTINIPADWIEIPKLVLDEYSRRMSAKTPGMDKQIFDYGYQLKRGDELWMMHPYILIQVKRGGKISQEMLDLHALFDAEIEKEGAALEQKSDKLLSDFRSSRKTYDKEAQMFWLDAQFKVGDDEIIKCLMGMKLTNEGIIQIMAYAREGTYNEYRPMYEEIIRKVELSEVLKYSVEEIKPVAKGLNWSEMLLYAALGFAGIGLFYIIVSIKRKR